ncbi:hypothetical protein BH11ARM2_BH11ARM2_08740 [soil metagenome]
MRLDPGQPSEYLRRACKWIETIPAKTHDPALRMKTALFLGGDIAASSFLFPSGSHAREGITNTDISLPCLFWFNFDNYFFRGGSTLSTFLISLTRLIGIYIFLFSGRTACMTVSAGAIMESLLTGVIGLAIFMLLKFRHVCSHVGGAIK